MSGTVPAGVIEVKPTVLAIVLNGDGQVGKTTLTLRYCGADIDGVKKTEGMAPQIKDCVELGGNQTFNLNIFDLEGQHILVRDPQTGEEFLQRELFYNGVQRAAGIVYSITDSTTFANALDIREPGGDRFRGFLGELLERLKIPVGERNDGNADNFLLVEKDNEIKVLLPILLIGNKSDLNAYREVPVEYPVDGIKKLRNFISSNRSEWINNLPPADFTETSAFSSANVQVVFALLGKKAQVYDGMVNYYKPIEELKIDYQKQLVAFGIEDPWEVSQLVEENFFKQLAPKERQHLAELGRKYVDARRSYVEFVDEIAFVSKKLPDFYKNVVESLQPVIENGKKYLEKIFGTPDELEDYLLGLKKKIISSMEESYEQLPRFLDEAPVSMDLQRIYNSLPDHFEKFADKLINHLRKSPNNIEMCSDTVEVLPEYLKNRFLQPGSNYDIAGINSAWNGFADKTAAVAKNIQEKLGYA